MALRLMLPSLSELIGGIVRHFTFKWHMHIQRKRFGGTKGRNAMISMGNGSRTRIKSCFLRAALNCALHIFVNRFRTCFHKQQLKIRQ